METDTLTQAIAGILSQYHFENGVKSLHPIDYHAKVLSLSERNWLIYDTELWAIISCFRRWNSWLKGLPTKINIYMDHHRLQYFNTKQRLNSKQASWYLELCEYNYVISYKPGAVIGKPDVLIRRVGNEKAGAEERVFALG